MTKFDIDRLEGAPVTKYYMELRCSGDKASSYMHWCSEASKYILRDTVAGLAKMTRLSLHREWETLSKHAAIDSIQLKEVDFEIDLDELEKI